MEEEKEYSRDRDNYKKQIARHKLNSLYRILGIVFIMAIVAIVVIIQYKRHVYTDYDVIGSVEREKAYDAKDVAFAGSVLTYSKDGCHCTNSKGVVVWNQTYEFQDVMYCINGDVAAVSGYNDREIYIGNTEKLLGKISTTMPIKNMTVSATGVVTAILDEGNVTWINTYNAEGEELFRGQVRMTETGYPFSACLSPNGELLAVSYMQVDSGKVRTNVIFYNFGQVGTNYSDYIVSTYSYDDLLIPKIFFMDNSTAFAMGDSRLMIYSGNQKPVSSAERLFEGEVLSLFYDEKHIGMVFRNDEGDEKYKLLVYDTKAEERLNLKFDLDYSNILFDGDNAVIYSENQAIISTMGGLEKFNGFFDKNVNIMLPTTSPYRYYLVNDTGIDTIQLK